MRRGFSLLEVMLASLAMLFVAAGFVALTVASSRSYNKTTTRNDLVLPISQTVAHISRDIQEARATTVNSSTQITITLPTQNADGSYNRTVSSTTNYIEYFRADANNNPSASGTFLVRRVGGANPMRMARNISNVTFATDASSSIEITISATSNGVTYTVTQRTAFMRNY